MSKVKLISILEGASGRVSSKDETCFQTIESSGQTYTTKRKLKREKPATEAQYKNETRFGKLNVQVAHWMKTHHDHPLYQRLYKEHRDNGIEMPLLNYIGSLVHAGKIELPE